MEKEKKRISRQIMLIIVWIALAVIMATAITVTGVSVLSSQIRKDREQSVVGAAKLAANAINADRINDWLENGKDEEYENTFETLSDIRDNTPYLKYLYVYQIREDGCHVVFDTDTEEPGSLADLQEFDETFLPYVPSLLEGKGIDMLESDDSFGWLLTTYQPILDSNGKCVAYAGADISMDEIREYTRNYVLLIVSIAAVFLIACVFIGLKMHINTNRAAELDKLREQQQRDKQLIREIIESFAKVIDMKDSYTQGHSSRVAKYTAMLAKELGYNEDTVEQYYNIALMHDIGKVSIPDQVLNKPGKLTDEEFDTIKSHTVRGADVLGSISLMPDIIVGAESHHERPDGKGYPKGLKGEEIPRVAQIIAVADTFDAMYSDRPYRDRMNYDKAIDIIRNASGTQLTPDVVDAFLRLAEKGEFRAPDDTGGGTTEDISNIHKNQE
ncbi:MAG: HD domain-containing protein [Eubacterium sp.]|nr:HD domain-containing protein [Eubacterium sp.]MBR0412685.1 HD domain-containing protein [Eubacterium sp.]